MYLRHGRHFNDERHGVLLHATQRVLPAVEKLTVVFSLSRLSVPSLDQSLAARNTAVPDEVLLAIEKTTDGEIVFSLYTQTPARSVHFFCRNVSYRRCVDRLPPAIRHVHVYVWKESVSGIFSRCR